MNKDKIIVLVSASFEKGPGLFDWLKKFAKYHDEHFAYWDEFAFTTQSLPQYDAILILNTISEQINAFCDPSKLIAFMMEPGIKDLHPWMFKGLEQYATVYSPVSTSQNTVISHGFMGWYFQQDYNYLKELGIPEKTQALSCIVSSLQQLEGHRLRLKFINQLKQELPEIDLFGKGIRYIPDKMDGLLPYRFSIAIENSSAPFYFTEKINDCFLTYTIPFYYGCKNISRFFPERSYIPIDIYDTKDSIRKIRDTIEKDDWQSRLEALNEARDLVLQKYQPLAGCAEILRNIPSSLATHISLRPVRKTALKRITTTLFKIKKKKTL